MDILILKNISKRFRNKEVLKGINLSVKKGEVLALVGRSGSGKSVLIKIIIGFFESDSGRIILNTGSKFPINYSMQENAIYENFFAYIDNETK